ncbi:MULTISPECIES: hypothetical protein [unclassified Rhodococcus (in: high G+C Gram-positive bacteria)]|uniref:hypothetical protein n=1 Tax=unclassified Rhodococcus (in: high G+C Gram-positive bacteria) TaxID=192944 RepID=UPI0020789FD7|nr:MULTISPECIES: hypothetical protein [unclassified Rhodococcus (in: high G+C Gram-positive bacteria)]
MCRHADTKRCSGRLLVHVDIEKLGRIPDGGGHRESGSTDARICGAPLHHLQHCEPRPPWADPATWAVVTADDITADPATATEWRGFDEHGDLAPSPLRSSAAAPTRGISIAHSELSRDSNAPTSGSEYRPPAARSRLAWSDTISGTAPPPDCHAVIPH